jgi:hypothetical protein
VSFVLASPVAVDRFSQLGSTSVTPGRGLDVPVPFTVIVNVTVVPAGTLLADAVLVSVRSMS